MLNSVKKYLLVKVSKPSFLLENKRERDLIKQEEWEKKVIQWFFFSSQILGLISIIKVFGNII